MSGRDNSDCGAEAAGSGTSERTGAEFDPFAERDDATTTPNTTRSVKVGRPVSDAAYRALKERARTQGGTANRIAQEIAHGSHDNDKAKT